MTKRKRKNALLVLDPLPAVNIPFYPATKHIPAGTALMVWVVDRWNQGEYEDFKKDELVDTQQNHTCYLSAEAAMKDVEDDVRNEMDENREYESEPDMIEELQTKDWKMVWKRPEKGKDGTKIYTSEDTWDGSMYMVRAIPLYLK